MFGSSPIDIQKAISNFGGNKDMFMSTLQQFTGHSMNQQLSEIQQSVLSGDFAKVQSAVHQIKAPLKWYFLMFIILMFSYIGAEKGVEAANGVQQAAGLQDTLKTASNYLTLLGQAQAIQTFSAKLTDTKPDVSTIEKYGKNN